MSQDRNIHLNSGACSDPKSKQILVLGSSFRQVKQRKNSEIQKNVYNSVLTCKNSPAQKMQLRKGTNILKSLVQPLIASFLPYTLAIDT